MSSIHERIKKRRTEVGMTLLQLATATGVKEATAQRWESGAIKDISYVRVIQIAEALHCTPHYLMGWEDSLTATDNYSDKEKRLIQLYRRADERDKNTINNVLDRYDEEATIGQVSSS